MAAPVLQAEGSLAVVTTGSLTVTLPAHVANDILIVGIGAWVPNSAASIADVATPAGWSRIDGALIRPGAQDDGTIAYFWKRATSGAEANPVFTRPAGWDTGTDGAWTGRGYTIRGCHTSGTPWDWAALKAPQFTANGTLAAVNVIGPERTVIHFLVSNDDWVTAPTSAGWTAGTAATTATGTDGGHRTLRKDSIAASTSGDAMTIAAPAAGAYVSLGIAFKPPHIASAYDQELYRFRNDDGSETTATWNAALNTGINLALGGKIRLRIGFRENGTRDPETPGFSLQYRVNGGAWIYLVSSPGQPVRVVASPNVVDFAATTQQLGAGAGFVAGQTLESFGGVSAFDLALSGRTEWEWSLELPLGVATNGDVIEFQVVDNFFADPFTYTVIPTLTVGAGGPAPVHLAATMASTSTLAASLRTRKKLSTTMASTGTTTASLRARKRLATTMASTSTMTASMRVRKRLRTTLSSVSTMTASMRARKRLAATFGSSSTTSAALRTRKRLAATFASSGTLTARLNENRVTLAALFASAAVFTASLRTRKRLAATLSSAGTTTASLRTRKRLAATLTSTATMTAALRTRKRLRTTFTSAGTMTASLRTRKRLAATLQSTSTFAASLRTRKRLAATMASHGTLTGALNAAAPKLLAATFSSVSALYARLKVGDELVAKVHQSLQMIRTRIGW